MRVNIDNWGAYFRQCPTVTLDGAACIDVIEADDAIGYVVVYDREEKDGPVKLDEYGHHCLTRRLFGAVKIVGVRWPVASRAIPSRLMRF